jgi:hypothetical protein
MFLIKTTVQFALAIIREILKPAITGNASSFMIPKKTYTLNLTTPLSFVLFSTSHNNHSISPMRISESH